MTASLPDWRIITLALLYSIGAHGIMTLNDFKSVEGDKRMGVRSLPVQLGVDRAARLACIVMAIPQFVVIGLLFSLVAADSRMHRGRAAARPVRPDGQIARASARAGGIL